MAMIMDFLIGFLLLLSAAINILALGAFFVTPSLRSTSNRFVINLLIVNVIGCLILAPSLLFNSNIIRRLYSEDTQTEVTSSPPTRIAFNKSTIPSRMPDDGGHRIAVNGNEINSTMYKIDNQLHFTVANNTPIIPRSTSSSDAGDGVEALESDTQFHQIRPWILDVIAAIGALSLVLVVGDTYCAVTDPLRYHSTVSASRVGFLLILVWCIALGFGISSGLRSQCIDDITLQASLYNTIFGSTYFICIIIVPFSLVCAMYWGIIREARKNGLRLRHNGSSPLIQSVLHIGPHPAQTGKKDSTASEEGHFACSNAAGTAATNYERRQKCSLGIESSLRRNKSAQYLMGPTATCECCEQILITRSISNQSAYLNSSPYLKVPNRDLRTARSTPDLHQNLSSEARTPFEHILSAPRPTKSLGYMTSIRHRLSNASSLFKYREESRAARISILVVIMFLVSYIPFGLLVLTEGHDSLLSTYQQTVLAIFFVVLANIVSPLIFAYRNKRVRRGIKRLVSINGRTGCTRKDRGDNLAANGSIKEISERNNNSPKIIKLTRHKSVDILRNGSAGLSLVAENSINGGQKRKLVIFNGKNGQISKLCHPDHHKEFIQLKGSGSAKGYNKDQLLARADSCSWSRYENPLEIGGGPSQSLTLSRTANRNPKVKSSSCKKGVVKDTEPFLRQIRSSPGNTYKKAYVSPVVVPEVNIDFPSKPIDV